MVEFFAVRFAVDLRHVLPRVLQLHREHVLLHCGEDGAVRRVLVGRRLGLCSREGGGAGEGGGEWGQQVAVIQTQWWSVGSE